MADKDSPQSVIDSFHKKQKATPFIIGSLAVILVVVGVIILVVWLAGPERPSIGLLSSATATVTETATHTPVTPTLTETVTPTETLTPTITVTETPSGPFEYTVQEDDNCWDIANTFEVDLAVLQAINNFGNNCPIVPGDVILIPAPGQALPTETPLPTGLAAGTKIEYTIKTGDTLASIASTFNTTVETIMKDNKIADANTIYVGQVLTLRVNLVTPTITLAPSKTPETSQTATP